LNYEQRAPHLAAFYEVFDKELKPWLEALEIDRKKQRRSLLWKFPLSLFIGLSLIEFIYMQYGNGWPEGLISLFILLAMFALPFSGLINIQEKVQNKLRPLLEKTLGLQEDKKHQVVNGARFVKYITPFMGRSFHNISGRYRGTYKGVHFYMQNGAIWTSWGANRHYVPVITGLFIDFTFAAPLAEKILVYERCGLPISIFYRKTKLCENEFNVQEIKTGHKEFDKKFLTFSRNKDEVPPLFTKALTDKLLGLRDIFRRYRWMRFMIEKNHLCLAIQSRDNENFKFWVKRDLVTEALDYAENMSIAHQIIDLFEYRFKRGPL
jgi:hypothetical protein